MLQEFHLLFCLSGQLALETILDVLTPDDIRILTETIDENNRRGDFIRIFPSPSSQCYHVYFEQQRYYNVLLQAWCNKYQKMESIGRFYSSCGRRICRVIIIISAAF